MAGKAISQPTALIRMVAVVVTAASSIKHLIDWADQMAPHATSAVHQAIWPASAQMLRTVMCGPASSAASLATSPASAQTCLAVAPVATAPATAVVNLATSPVTAPWAAVEADAPATTAASRATSPVNAPCLVEAALEAA